MGKTKYFLYEIVNLVTKASYVGISHDPKKRIASHFEDSSNWRLRAAVRHFGRDKFKARCIRTFPNLQKALEAETNEIDRRRQANLAIYNESEGGEHPWSRDVRLEDAKLRSLVNKAYRMTADDPPDVQQFRLQPYVPLADKAKVKKQKVRIILRDEDEVNLRLTKLFRSVQKLGAAAYHGTDRMDAEDSRWWSEHKGPILRMSELGSRLSTSPRNWPDRDAWAKALPKIEPG